MHTGTRLCLFADAHALVHKHMLTWAPRVRPPALQRIFSPLRSLMPPSPGPGDPLPPCMGCGGRREGSKLVWQGWITPSPPQLKTPVGRGRAFLRYCLVHRQLAESLQLCLLDPESLR